MGVDAFSIQGFATILNCKVMKVLFKYVGLPIEGCHKREAFWDGVVARIKSRLGRWKGRNLSMNGRICLIKSVLVYSVVLHVNVYVACCCNEKRLCVFKGTFCGDGVLKGGRLLRFLRKRFVSPETVVGLE